MVDNQKIKNILSLAIRLENLCEGFDETNKSAVLTSRIKVLLEISKAEFVTPNILKTNVGLAKSNIAILCNALTKESLIKKNKDSTDTREISYSITEKGLDELDKFLSKAKKNFEGRLAYKNNMKQIDESVENLLQLVK